MGCAGSSAKDSADDHGNGGEGAGGYDDQAEDEYQPLTQEEVNARIQCCDSTQHFTLGSTGFKLRYAYLSQRGYYPEDLYKNNQDSFRVVHSFNGDPNTILFGVFDGHGSDGDACSYFVRDNIERCLKSTMAKCPDDFERAYKEAFVQVNTEMHEQAFDDSMSGTTAITAYFSGTEVFVANIGDSRAIIGEKKGKRVIAYSLSIDQTPYRKDERERVKAAGAVIMSCDQLEGITEFHENWNVALGDELDNGGDPPRVWAPGKSFPGCAFTRSIGDSVAETIGVFAEPELLCKELTNDDKFLVVASDGVWEFITNQSVADMILKFTEPLDACRAVVAESYRLWLQYEVRTDDITMILAFIESPNGDGPATAPDESTQPGLRRKSSRRESRRGSADSIFLGMDVVKAGGENRPVRRGLSKEKRQAMMIAAKAEADDDEEYVPTLVAKAPEEMARIAQACKANFLFAHLSPDQMSLVQDVMVKKAVTKGEVVIKQGDPGDWFYVVESGEYDVLVNQGDKDVKVFEYSTSGGTNPCFGELALLYSKPRAATVMATCDGQLWAMDRKSFRAILMKSSSSSLMRTLRSVDVLKSLSVSKLQRLEDILTEVKYEKGDYVIRQGEFTDTFYIIVEGEAEATKRKDPDNPAEEAQVVMELNAGKYFGEGALIQHAPRQANVVAKSKLKCLYISKDAFEEVLGPLQDIIDDDRRTREKVALSKQLQAEAEGLSNVSKGAFAPFAVASTFGGGMMGLVKHQHSGRDYTIKAVNKAKVYELGLHERIINEHALAAGLASHSSFVPLSLGFFADSSCLYSIFKVQLVADLAEMLDAVTFDESVASFYVANILLAVEHLHAEGICVRNLSPDNLYIDQFGFVQLMDLKYAVKIDVLPRDFCGLPYYLSPEQVAGQGHSFPVDLWAIGILTYEMLTKTSPWHSTAEHENNEVGFYSKITKHTKGSLSYPTEFSSDLKDLLNDLLNPQADARIGCRGGGFEELRLHPWFGSLDMNTIAHKSTGMSGDHNVPYHAASFATSKAKEIRAAGPGNLFNEAAYTGPTDWFSDWASFNSKK